MDKLDLAYGDDVISYELKVSDFLLSRPLPAWVSNAINEAGDSGNHPIYRHLVNSRLSLGAPILWRIKLCSRLVSGITVMFF